MLKPPDKTLWVATDEQVRDALNIIKPAADRAACAEKIKTIVGFIGIFRDAPATTPGQTRNEYLAMCKVLHEMAEPPKGGAVPAGGFFWTRNYPQSTRKRFCGWFARR